MRILFVINPASGKKEENKLEEQIDEQAGISGFDYQLYYMHGGNVIKDISRRIYSYKPQIVAAAGGRAVQVFTALPMYYNEKAGLKPEKAAKVHEALDARDWSRADRYAAVTAKVLDNYRAQLDKLTTLLK